MNVIPPIALTDAMLYSSTAIETAPAAYAGGTTYALNDTVSVAGSLGLLTVYKSLQAANTGHAPASSPDWWAAQCEIYAAYSGATTYAVGDTVQDNTTHKVYESLAAGNVGNALTDTTKWLYLGFNNRWAMFDLLRNTATVHASEITVVLAPGQRINSVALLGLVADSVTVRMDSGPTSGANYYTFTEDLTTRDVFNWYDYFFVDFTVRTNILLLDLPPYATAYTTITLTRAVGDVECGACVIGSKVYLGEVQHQAESDVINFSSVTREFDGSTATMIQRRNVPKSNQTLLLDKSRVNVVRAARDLLNATPAVWSGLDDDTDGYFESLLILGFYKRFSINLALPEHAIITLELEEI